MRPTGNVNMSVRDAFKFPKLNSQNYVVWSVHMQSALQAKYLWLIVKGTEACPPNPRATPPASGDAALFRAARQEYINWVTRDKATQGLMHGAVEETQWPHVTDADTSKGMWDQWKKIHQTNQQVINIHYCFEELYTRKYSNGMVMTDHIAAMLDIRNQIVQAGEKLDDLYIVWVMILLLLRTSSWDLIKIQLFNLKKLTVKLVSTKLRVEANRCTHERAQDQMALVATAHQKPKGARGRAQAKPDDKCHTCHKKGHWANKCPQ